MDKQKEQLLLKQVTAGLAHCLAKLNKVSPGVWRLEAVEILHGGDPAALRRWTTDSPSAIRVDVNTLPPAVTLLFFSETDAEHIYRCYVGGSLYEAIGPGWQEATLFELANVLLNAVANSLLRVFGRSGLSSVPSRAESVLEVPAGSSAVFARLSATLGGRTADTVTVAIIPDAIT